MSRRRRVSCGGVVYHVFNRGSRKGPLFRDSDDYISFLRLTSEARALRSMRIIAYCLMPNHWHFLLWPEEDNQLSKFMHWLTGTHAGRWRRDTASQGQGAVYQSRFMAVPVESVRQLLTAWRYVERNPVEAGLVSDAQDWPWSSAGQASNPTPDLVLDGGPLTKPADWLTIVNQPEIEFDTDVRFA